MKKQGAFSIHRPVPAVPIDEAMPMGGAVPIGGAVSIAGAVPMGGAVPIGGEAVPMKQLKKKQEHGNEVNDYEMMYEVLPEKEESSQ